MHYICETGELDVIDVEVVGRIAVLVGLVSVLHWLLGLGDGRGGRSRRLLRWGFRELKIQIQLFILVRIASAFSSISISKRPSLPFSHLSSSFLEIL